MQQTAMRRASCGDAGAASSSGFEMHAPEEPCPGRVPAHGDGRKQAVLEAWRAGDRIVYQRDGINTAITYAEQSG